MPRIPCSLPSVRPCGARAEFGISQEELAHRAGIDRSYMSSIERGGQNVGLISAARIAKAMETSLSDLVLMAKL